MSASTTPHLRARPRGAGSYWLYLIPGGVLFLAVVVLPFLANVYLSMTTWKGVGTPEWTGADNYTRLLGDEIFWTSFRNSVAMIIAMVVVPTLVGLLLAAALFDYVARKVGSRAASWLRATFYLPQILPVVVSGIVWGWLLKSDGAFNAILDVLGLGSWAHDWLGSTSTALPSVMLMMIWAQIGYPVVIFMSALARVDPELYEAAELDGAGWWRRFRAITVPQIRPETFVVTLTCTIAALKVFGPIWALTRGGPEHSTMVPSYFSYYQFFRRFDVGYGSAVATVLTGIIFLIAVAFLVIQRRVERQDEGVR